MESFLLRFVPSLYVTRQIQKFKLPTQDIGHRIEQDTLMDLYPAIPVSVLTLLVDFYSSRIFLNRPVYGTNFVLANRPDSGDH